MLTKTEDKVELGLNPKATIIIFNLPLSMLNLNMNHHTFYQKTVCRYEFSSNYFSCVKGL